MSRGYTGNPFPAADRDIDVKWIEFDQPRDSAGALGRENCRSAAAEGIEDEPIALAAVANEISKERNGLHRRMQGEVAAARRMKAVDAGIIEHVRAISPLRTQAEIVDV